MLFAEIMGKKRLYYCFFFLELKSLWDRCNDTLSSCIATQEFMLSQVEVQKQIHSEKCDYSRNNTQVVLFRRTIIIFIGNQSFISCEEFEVCAQCCLCFLFYTF